MLFTMKVVFTSLFLLIFCTYLHRSHAQGNQTDEFNQIQDQIFESFQGDIYIPYLDQTATYLLTKLQTNGAFEDINYNDQSQTLWKPGDHLTRMSLLAKAYSNPGSSYFNQSAMLSSITQSIQYWLSLTPPPSSTNWYYYSISVPKDIGNTLICLRKAPNGISQTLENSLIQWMTKGVPITTSPSSEGSNLIDVATHYVMRASLIRSATLMNQAVNAVSASIEITTGEGIQIDNSFRAHGSQLYTYGYGTVFFSGITSIARFVANTSYQINPAKRAIISNFIRNGYIQASRGQYTDFNVFNRGISRPDAGKAEVLQIERFKAVDDISYLSYYDNVLARMKGQVTPSTNVAAKHLHFWRSDYTVHHRPAYMLGLRTVSNRTVKAENGNGENLKGYYMTDGATYIAVNGNEYDGIYPVWDWNKLPGTTVPQLGTLPVRSAWGTNPGTVSFVGGVSDGLYGVSTYAMNDYNTKAKKGWFFFDQEIVCLGSDITSTAPQVINTTINQSLLDGNITVKTNAGTQTLSKGSYSYQNNLQWVYHDSVGYFFPQGGNLNLQSQTQTGSQKSINNGYSDDPISKDVFKLWFPHGANPAKKSYAYVIVPGLANITALNSYNPNNIEILANTDTVQVVRHKQLNIWQAVFYKRGTFNSQGVSITVDKPSTLILKRINTTNIEVIAADPTQQESQLLIGLSTPFIQTKKQLKFTLPNGSSAGSSISGEINLNSNNYVDPGLEINNELKIVADAYVQDGASANINFGDTPTMQVKFDGTGFNRQAFLKFDPGMIERPVSRAILRMYVTSANTTAHTTDWQLHRTEHSNWTEGGITWNNRPAVKQEVGKIPGTSGPGFIDWDVTQTINTLLDGELLSLRLSSTQKGDKTDAKFASRENPNENLRPILLIENKPVATTLISAMADSWVRSGEYANKNYGSAGYTVVRGGNSDINNTYYKFNLKGLKNPVDATLRLYNKSSVNTTWTIRRIQNNGWSEGGGNSQGNGTSGITWNNAPTQGTDITNFSGQANEGYVYFNISSILHTLSTDSIVTFRVSSSNNIYSSFTSKNSPNVQERPAIILNSLKPAPLEELQTFPITGDAFVRGGSNSSDNYGNVNVLTVKNDQNDAFSREVYIKTTLNDISRFTQKVILRMYVTYAGATITNTNWEVYGINTNNWNENTITWSNRPSATTLITSISGAQAGNYVDFDLTEYVRTAAGTGTSFPDQTLSVKIVSTVQGSTTDVSFSSKESNNPGLRPEIIILGNENTSVTTNSFEFSGRRIADGAIELEWNIPAENGSFEVQRSENGSFFENIGRVDNPVEIESGLVYQFNDHEFGRTYPYPLFYRIKPMTQDAGREEYRVISVSGDRNARIIFGPNPTSGHLTIQLPAKPSVPLDFNLLSVTGSVIKEMKLSEENVKLDLSGYPKGIYIGVITHVDGTRETIKIVLN